jgi:tRNA nucleotidyltransferase/poly(A) polymerase
LEGYRRRQNTCHRYTIYKHIVETVDRVPACLSLRLTALLHDVAKPRVRQKKGRVWWFPAHEKASARLAEEIMDRLKFSKDTIRKVTHLIVHHMIVYNPDWSDSAVRRLIRRVGRQNISDLLFFRKADILAHGVHDDKLDLLRQLEDRINGILNTHVVFHTSDLAIDGHKVMEILGVPQGPKVGQVLNILMEQVAEKPQINTEKGLTAVLKQMKRSRR